MLLQKYTITLEPKHLIRNYFLYIIQLTHKKDNYYYIGHTYDQQNINTALPFLRLAEHFDNTNSSTHNQIYKYIVNNIVAPSKKEEEKKIDDNIKNKVEAFLSESKVVMSVYPLLEFDTESLSKSEHKENIKKVKDFENLILRIFMEASKKLMNKEKNVEFVKYNDIEFQKVWDQIKKDFYV
jgi:hypothetical protein